MKLKSNEKLTNKFKLKIFILTTFLLFCSVILYVYALKSYFSKEQREKITIKTKFPSLDIKRVDSNINDKLILIPLSIPNFNQEKYTHTKIIQHELILNQNEIDIQVPLFLKIFNTFDTHNTFTQPEKYFNVNFKIINKQNNYIFYEDDKRPQMICESNGIGKIVVNIEVQQEKILSQNNPELDLVIFYDLLDEKGQSFSGGSNNKVSNPSLNLLSS
jgi:hypothetical protein